MNATPSRRMLSLWSALLFLGAAFAGCMGTTDASAKSSLYVKDALTDDVAEVHVTFVAAEALPEGAQEWITVYAGERSIELLSLSDTLAREKLADFELAPGDYAGLRIAVSHVETVDNNGTRTALAVLGNVVTLGKDFTVAEDGSIDLVADFDLEEGVDLANGTYTPHVKDIQTSREDADEDGTPDLDDRDDDNDGLEDAEDADRDGDGEEDAPAQEHAMDQRGVFGLCTAWNASETGREHGEAGNSTAFTWLHEQAAAENQTVEEYCAEQQPPVPDQARGVLEMVGKPVSLRGKPEDIPRGKPADIPQGKPEGTPGDEHMPDQAQERPDGAPEGTPGGEHAPDEAAADHRPENRTGAAPEDGDGNRTHEHAAGNESHDAPVTNESSASNETYEAPAGSQNETSQPESTPQEGGSQQQPSDGSSTPTRPSDG